MDAANSTSIPQQPAGGHHDLHLSIGTAMNTNDKKCAKSPQKQNSPEHNELIDDQPLLEEDTDGAADPGYELGPALTDLTSISDVSAEDTNTKIPAHSNSFSAYRAARKRRNSMSFRKFKCMTETIPFKIQQQLKSKAHGRGRHSPRKQYRHPHEWAGKSNSKKRIHFNKPGSALPAKTSLAVSGMSKMAVAWWLRANWQQCDSRQLPVYIEKIKRERKFGGKNLSKLNARQLEVLARRELGLRKGEADYQSFLHAMHRLLTLRRQSGSRQVSAPVTSSAIRPLPMRDPEQVGSSDIKQLKSALNIASKSSRKDDAKQKHEKDTYPEMHTVSNHKKKVSRDTVLSAESAVNNTSVDRLSLGESVIEIKDEEQKPTTASAIETSISSDEPPIAPSAAGKTSLDRLSLDDEDEKTKETTVRAMTQIMELAEKPPAIGDQIGQYKIESGLIEGGFGQRATIEAMQREFRNKGYIPEFSDFDESDGDEDDQKRERPKQFIFVGGSTTQPTKVCITAKDRKQIKSRKINSRASIKLHRMRKSLETKTKRQRGVKCAAVLVKSIKHKSKKRKSKKHKSSSTSDTEEHEWI